MKEKGKGSPASFEEMLHPGETLLWAGTQFRQPVREIVGFSGRTFGIIFVVLLAALLFGGGSGSSRLGALIGITIFFIVVPTLIFMLLRAVRGLLGLGDSEARRYAITSERLLYRYKDRVLMLPLEELLAVRPDFEEGTRAALHFGPIFPAWHGVEDAYTVKRLIEDTRTQRLEEIKSHSVSGAHNLMEEALWMSDQEDLKQHARG